MGMFSKFTDPLGIKKKSAEAVGLGKVHKAMTDPFGVGEKLEDKTKEALGFDFEKFHLKEIGKDLLRNPERMLMGSLDPASTKMWNKVLGRDDKPIINQMGGPAEHRYSDYLEQGGDPKAAKNAATAHQVAGTVASIYAGGALGAAAGAGAGAAGATVTPAMQTAITAGARMAVPVAAGMADAEFAEDPISLEAPFMGPPAFRNPNVPGFRTGGYASPAQARLMRATAHGWKKPGGGGPSRAVAQEFVDAKDRNMYSGGFAENRYWTGGLAAMNEVNSGVPETLNFQAGGLAGLDPIVIDQGNIRELFSIPVYLNQGWTWDKGTSTLTPPQTTVTGEAGDPAAALAALTPEIRGGDEPEGTPFIPRVIPGAGPLIAGPTGQTAEERAEQTALARQSSYRDQLREHKSRVAAALNPSGAARGGHMKYQEGGAVPGVEMRPGLGGEVVGHAEGPNPYAKHIDTHPQMYAEWERRNHVDPAPIEGEAEIEPAIILPEEEGSAMDWLRNFLGVGDDSGIAKRSQREEERIEAEARGEVPAVQARGGRVGYQVGGLAQAQPEGFNQPPTGGVPPRWSGPQRQQWRGTAGNQAARQNLRGAYGSWSPQQQTGYRGRVGWQQPAPATPPPQQWSGVQQQQWRNAAGNAPKRQSLTNAYQSYTPEERAGYTGRVGWQPQAPAPAAAAAPPAAAPPAAAAAAQQWSPAQQQQWRNAAGNPAARQTMTRAYQSYSPEERAGYTGRVGFQLGGLASRIGGGGGGGMMANIRRMIEAQQRGAAPGRSAPPRSGGLAAMAQQQRQALPQGGGFANQMRRNLAQQTARQRAGGAQPQAQGFMGRVRQMADAQRQRAALTGGRGLTGPWQGSPETNPMRPGRRPRPPWMPRINDPSEGGGIPGGPRVPPNMRGFLQKQRMMNRPPPNVGGGVNRVGQQDQQGAQARAMQRGTGRRPMSRRGGFPGRGRR